jgi:hypothetical protein
MRAQRAEDLLVRRRWCAATVVFALHVGPSVLAQQSDARAVQPERPTVATHAGTVATGYLEIETGVERDRFDPLTVGYGAPTVFKIGVGSRAQLSIVVPLSRPSRGDIGLGDMGVGVKWRFVRDAPIVGDFALQPSVKFASGSQTRGTGTGTTDVSLLAISSHKFGNVAIDINAGYTRRSGDGLDIPRDATQWTFSSGGPLAGAFGWVVECYGYPGTGGPAGQAPIAALLAGPTYVARTWLSFDAGLIVPLRGPQPRAIYAGAVYNVGRIWASHR